MDTVVAQACRTFVWSEKARESSVLRRLQSVPRTCVAQSPSKLVDFFSPTITPRRRPEPIRGRGSFEAQVFLCEGVAPLANRSGKLNFYRAIREDTFVRKVNARVASSNVCSRSTESTLVY